jgi:hemerythrin-like domain-containing protein
MLNPLSPDTDDCQGAGPDAGFARRGAGDHPIVGLVREHDVIRLGLDAIATESLRIQRSFEVRLGFWMPALEWLELFVDRDHHAREEEVLFVWLQGAGMPMDRGPLAQVAKEHERARAVRGRMVQAVAIYDVRGLAEAAQEYSDRLRQHMEDEERLLFPLAMECLDAVALGELVIRLAGHRDQIGGAIRERADWLQRELLAGEPSGEDGGPAVP